jgi:hypothetical protein
MVDSNWLQIDERSDVLVSLSACLICVSECGRNPGLWKWAILALHNAVQGAMVCHLSGTAQLGALPLLTRWASSFPLAEHRGRTTCTRSPLPWSKVPRREGGLPASGRFLIVRA